MLALFLKDDRKIFADAYLVDLLVKIESDY